MATSPTLLRSRPARPVLATALSIGVIGCAATEHAGSFPDDKRRPDGIAVDPLETPPEAVDSAAASSGVVALRAPLGIDAAHATVRSFFEAVGREDGEALMKVLSIDAVWLNPSSRAREPAYSMFSRRFGRLDYVSLAGVTFWTEEHVLEGDDAIAAWAELVPSQGPSQSTPSASFSVDSLGPGDVVIRAPIHLGKGGAGSLFGSEIVIALRRDADRFVIHRLAEDFVLQP